MIMIYYYNLWSYFMTIYDYNQVWIIIWQVANGIAVAGLIAALCKFQQSAIFTLVTNVSFAFFSFMTYCRALQVSPIFILMRSAHFDFHQCHQCQLFCHFHFYDSLQFFVSSHHKSLIFILLVIFILVIAATVIFVVMRVYLIVDNV